MRGILFLLSRHGVAALSDAPRELDNDAEELLTIVMLLDMEDKDEDKELDGDEIKVDLFRIYLR